MVVVVGWGGRVAEPCEPYGVVLPRFSWTGLADLPRIIIIHSDKSLFFSPSFFAVV